MTDIDIRELRRKLKLTQQELAKKLGVDVITVSRWEREEARPSRLAQRELARLLRSIG